MGSRDQCDPTVARHQQGSTVRRPGAIMSLAKERIGLLQAQSSKALKLAEVVSLAVMVEPALLRRARLELVPGADAAAEADLWLSGLVLTSSPEGIVLLSDVAEALRKRLSTDPDRLL